jgi:hypothetical protein
MDKVIKSSLMDHYIKENSKMEKEMGLESSLMLTEMFMMEVGKTT